MAGRGMPVLKRSASGDLYVHVKVEIPRQLDDRQKDLLAEAAKRK